VSSPRRDKFGRFVPKKRRSGRPVVEPKRDAFGRFLGHSPFAAVVDEVVRAGLKQTKASSKKFTVERKSGQAEPRKRANAVLKVAPKKTMKVEPKKAPKKPAKELLKKLRKESPKKPGKEPPKKPGKEPPKKPGKEPPKKPGKELPKKPGKEPPKKPGKEPPKKPGKEPSKKLRKEPPKKPGKEPPKKPGKEPSKKLRKEPPKKPGKEPPKKPEKVPPRKPGKKPPKKPVPPKKPKKRKRRKKPPELPPIDRRSAAAEVEIQTRLLSLSQIIAGLEPGLSMGIHSFINADGTVDGELRIANLPPEWREQSGLTELTATLSKAFSSFRVFDRKPEMGGSFWFTVAVRFGPQNEAEMSELAELYKKYRGLFQIGTYPTRADHSAPLQLCLTDDRRGLRGMIDALAVKRGLPPTAVLIRFVWGPDWSPEVGGKRPGHYAGEKGKK
jgi:hypothetical protein